MQRKTFAIGTTVLALAFPASAAAGDDVQVGSQSNSTTQNASSNASTGHVVIIGNKNHVSGGSATASASNSNVTKQYLDQSQNGDGDGDGIQVGSQENKTKQNASCTASTGHVVIIGDKNKVKGGDASCEAKNENETHQELEQDQGSNDKGGKKKDKGNKKDGDNIQVGDQRNRTKQNAKCSAWTGDVVIPKGKKNEVHGGKASCKAENENETRQDLDQDQG